MVSTRSSKMGMSMKKKSAPKGDKAPKGMKSSPKPANPFIGGGDMADGKVAKKSSKSAKSDGMKMKSAPKKAAKKKTAKKD